MPFPMALTSLSPTAKHYILYRNTKIAKLGALSRLTGNRSACNTLNESFHVLCV